MILKGIVIKVKKNYAIVLSDENEYCRIKIKENIKVGQKIMYTKEDIMNTKKNGRVTTMNIKKYMAIAAAVLLIVTMSFIGINSILEQKILAKVVAIVTVDINPSVKVSIDNEDNVIKIEALNEDAESLDLSDLMGMRIDDAVEAIVKMASEAGYIDTDDLEDDYVLITTILTEDEEEDQNKDEDQNDEEDANSDKEKKEDKIWKLIKKKIEESDTLKNVNVAIIKATMAELKLAEKGNIPVGLLVVKGKINVDGETLSVKEFFSNKDKKSAFLGKGEIIEQDFDKKLELMGRYLNELDSDDVDSENLKAAFELSKTDYFEAKKIFSQAREEYKEALDSEDEEKINNAKQLMEEAEVFKDLMQQNKGDVELIKEQLKKQIEKKEEAQERQNENRKDEKEKQMKEQQDEEEKNQEKEQDKNGKGQEKAQNKNGKGQENKNKNDNDDENEAENENEDEDEDEEEE